MRRWCAWVLGLLVSVWAVCGAGCGEKDQVRPLAVQEAKLWRVPVTEDRIPKPRSATVGDHGEVVVLDQAGRVLFYDAGGEVVRIWHMPTNENGNAEGAAWLRDGRVVVADTHYFRLVFFDASGQVVQMIGEKGRGDGQFECPVSVRQDAETGELYVAEYWGNDRVQVFNEAGEFLRSFGRPGTGPGEFQRAADLVLHGEHVYVADAINGRVHVYRKDGTFVRMVGELSGEKEKASSEQAGDDFDGGDDGDGLTYDQKAKAAGKMLRGKWGELLFDYPYGIAIGGKPGGREKLYVIEWGGGRYVRVDLENETVDGVYGKPGRGKGEMRTPWGIAVDGQGHVIVVDTENCRLVEVIEGE